MNPLRDLGQVADLIEAAFASDLDRSGRNALRELRWLSRMKPVLWWMVLFNTTYSDFLSGFVWEEDDQIVGNVTVNRATPHARKWMISNVAVAEPYRGQGIARSLMYAALSLIREEGGSAVSLQVRANNKPALHLYQSLNFEILTGTAHLSCAQLPRVDIPPLPKKLIWRNRAYGSYDARLLCDLARAATPLPVQQEWPIRQRAYRLDYDERLRGHFARLMGGGPSLYQVVDDGQRLVGMVNAHPGTWGRLSRIEMLVHPDWRGELEIPLLSQAIAYLYPWRSRKVRVKHPTEHHAAVAAYRALGFTEDQVLLWMKRVV